MKIELENSIITIDGEADVYAYDIKYYKSDVVYALSYITDPFMGQKCLI